MVANMMVLVEVNTVVIAVAVAVACHRLSWR